VDEKPHDAVVKFNTYRNLQRHRAVLPAIARLSCIGSAGCVWVIMQDRCKRWVADGQYTTVISDMTDATDNIIFKPRAASRCYATEIFYDNVLTLQFVRPTQNVSSAWFSARLADTWECPTI